MRRRRSSAVMAGRLTVLAGLIADVAAAPAVAVSPFAALEDGSFLL